MAAAGVLANDTSPLGHPLTAVRVSGPSHGTLTLNANGSFAYKPAAGYSGPDSFTYTANDGGLASAPATVGLTVRPSPKVTAVVIGDGTAQRSEIRSVTVTFDSLVTFDAGAFYVARPSGAIPVVTPHVTQANRQTTVVLTFSGAAAAYGGLNDGNWALRVRALRVHRADDRSVTMAADSVTRFHRLFGDADGDRDVDATDKTAFLAALGRTDAASLAAFDYNGDGLIDGDGPDPVQRPVREAHLTAVKPTNGRPWAFTYNDLHRPEVVPCPLDPSCSHSSAPVPPCAADVTVFDKPPATPANTQYVANRPPLKPSGLVRLPPGAVKPDGRFKAQLRCRPTGSTATCRRSAGSSRRTATPGWRRTAAGNRGGKKSRTGSRAT